MCLLHGKKRLWKDDIITKVIVKANINYYHPTGDFNFLLQLFLIQQ